jgi:hypothetical protein
MSEQTPYTQSLPGFTPSHERTRHWSGVKQSPHAVRSGCGCGMLAPGAIHYLLTDPGKGQAVVCALHYEQSRAEDA